tara:strand:+ start:82 stop:981 length:900 start_codon:yes stop_codon:yes gene_type:complete
MTTNINDITTSVLIVRTTLGKWNNTVQDKRLKNKIAEVVGADANHLSAGKKLLLSPVVKELSRLHGQFTNQIIRKKTLPFKPAEHLIRNVITTEFETAWDAKKDVWDEKLPELRREYNDYIQQDRVLLGDSFNINDYPPVDEVIKCYKAEYEYDFLPVANENLAAMLDLPKAKIAKIEAAVEKRVTGKIDNAMKVVHDRVLIALGDLIAGLERHGLKPDGAQRASKFSSNNIDKIKEITEILPALNLTGDPALTQAANDLVEKLGDIDDAETLRKDSGKRIATAERAKIIVSKLAGFYD